MDVHDVGPHAVDRPHQGQEPDGVLETLEHPATRPALAPSVEQGREREPSRFECLEGAQGSADERRFRPGRGQGGAERPVPGRR